jgi:small subunit ribosomal protein S17
MAEQSENEETTAAVAEELAESAPQEPQTSSAAPKGKRAAKPKPVVAMTPQQRQEQRAALRAKKALARRRGRAADRESWKAGAHERTATPAREHESGMQKTRQGVVVSDKAEKTITVRIDVARRHRRYQKVVRTSTTLHAHDEHNDAHVGDTVVVRESRPLSRTKRWRLVQVVERAR